MAFPSSKEHFTADIPVTPLSVETEKMVLAYAARGHSEKETARKMSISPATVKSYKYKIGKKIGFEKSRIEYVIILVYRLGWWKDEKYLNHALPFQKNVEAYLAQNLPIRQKDGVAYARN